MVGAVDYMQRGQRSERVGETTDKCEIREGITRALKEEHRDAYTR